MSTDYGEIIIEVYERKAPVTANHFLKYISERRLNNAFFYRAVRTDNLNPILHENTQQTGISHHDGVISMARSEPGTANSEFFICIGDQPSLDFGGSRNPDGQGFAAFGKVIHGMEVVRSIQKLPTSGEWQFLQKPVRIKNVVILDD